METLILTLIISTAALVTTRHLIRETKKGTDQLPSCSQGCDICPHRHDEPLPQKKKGDR
jgi:hypothetical protein